MKSKLSKKLLLTTGLVAISGALITLGLKSTKSSTNNSGKSSTTYI